MTAGSYNLRAAVQVCVQSLGADTRFGQIVALMESASLQKPRLAQLADRIARPFLVGVLLAAALAAAWWWRTDPGHALMVAVAVLVVTCPCALSLATPVAMLTAAGTLARSGVLVRNLQALEALAGVDTVVFDKTGTLTRDGLQLRQVHPAAPAGLSHDEALGLAALLACHSLHPVARAIAAAAPAPGLALPGWELEGSVQEMAGAGLVATARQAGQGACTLRLGSAAHARVGRGGAQAGQHAVLSLERGGQVAELARFTLAEHLRPEAAEVVRQLQQAGVAVLLLSGDRDAAVQGIAAQAGIDAAQGDCAPQDKLARLRQLQDGGHQVAMVGDGLNDGPVLAGAHVSFAFGRAVPLAQSSCDLVVMGDNLHAVTQALLLARRTLRIVRQNLWWAAGYNALGVPLAIAGLMPAWAAGLGMALSSLWVVANAARLARAPAAPAAAMAPDPSPRTLHTPLEPA